MEELRDDEEDEPVIQEVGHDGDGLELLLEVGSQLGEGIPQREEPCDDEQDGHDNVDAVFYLVDGPSRQALSAASGTF
jgi:hypothetical protein